MAVLESGMQDPQSEPEEPKRKKQKQAENVSWIATAHSREMEIPKRRGKSDTETISHLLVALHDLSTLVAQYARSVPDMG
eukprot:469248-Rhodomonas_salina.1